MRKIFVLVLFGFAISTFGFSQIPGEAFDLTNSLSDLWHEGKTEKAVETSVKLFEMHSPFFIDRVHNSLSQGLRRDNKSYHKIYLEQLYLKNNKDINFIITPVMLWCKALNAKDDSDLKSVLDELILVIDKNSGYDCRTERYSLLILQELEKRNAIDLKIKEEILKKNISNLLTYPDIDTPATGRNQIEMRAWCRFILANCYFGLYSINSDNEEYLKKAAFYSSDINDKQVKHAYFYDMVLLANTPDKVVDFNLEYFKYLVKNNRNTEALSKISEIAYLDPTNSNLEKLKKFYSSSGSAVLFNVYWQNYISKMGTAVPKVKLKYESEELDLTVKPGKWIYIDVWGTWCSPCVKELPDLQAFYVENKSRADKLSIYTFSYSSTDLKGFLEKNKYTFPVTEIDQKTNDLFKINSYPTKILITPDGSYIRIPFGVDWKMYVRNYAQL